MPYNVEMDSNKSRSRLDVLPGMPLWQRVPTRMPDGRPYHDFMMLIPGLREGSSARQREVMAAMEQVFASYGEAVMLADLNLKRIYSGSVFGRYRGSVWRWPR